MPQRSNFIVSQLDRQLRTQQVLEDEDFATMIVQSTMDGIYTFDRDLTITLWNRGMERISGIKKEEVVGHDVFLKFPFLLEIGLQSLILEPLKGNETPEKEGPWHNRETGRRGFSRRRSLPLKNEFGEVVGGLVIVREISEQKKAQDEVLVRRRAEERLRFLSDAGMLLSGTLEYSEVLKRIIELSSKQFGATCKIQLGNDSETLASSGRQICVPLEVRGRILGTYSLVGTDREFTEEDLSLARDLARWIALAIGNARLFAESPDGR